MTVRGLTGADFARTIVGSTRRRLARGDFRRRDFEALRLFVGLSQPEFCDALGITESLFRKWKTAERIPKGSSLVLLRIVAEYPLMLHGTLHR